ncbi:TlpA family protein disulfide reductase [Brumicola pallidula]|uniref:Thioredoxin related protein n=1 Tax=Brumicola pallidula DSM 14239 = ACAM 615 TaxID=1121922 RepID=K7A1H7_9ALTE|nr:TlpA disulfide reductase family protein [Glaciecola pallidula]GAC29350.1 thioredoxin related protein [Glaciecola pallidula DSM 14239 = ACAM 615]
MKKILLYLVVGIGSLTLGVSYQLSNRYDFTTLDGSTYRFEELQGKWVVINYFAEWCAPCLREIPELNEFKALTDGKQNAVLFGVSYDAMQDHELSLLAKKYNIEFPLINNVKTVLPFETPKYLPATYLIRPDGTLAGQLLGEQNSKSLKQAIAND